MSFTDTGDGARARRVLLLGDASAADALDARLNVAGYEVLRAEVDAAARVASDEAPDVVLVLVGGDEGGENGGDEDAVALARRLRADERTFDLPLALLFRADSTALRLAALGVGADDYFALSTPTAELCARLDSLLWRAEAGRLVPPPLPEETVEAAPRDVSDEAATEETAMDVEAGAASSATVIEDAGVAEVAEAAPSADALSAAESPAAPVVAAAEEVTRVFPDGRHTHARPQATTREARMIAALDASTERLTRPGARHAGAQGPAAGRPRRTGGPKRLLLVVSDAARMAQLNLLIRSAHYELRTAFDARQALSLLRIERPDLLLVDFELKDMDGVEMLRRLREQQGGRPEPPSILFAPAARASGLSGAGARAVVTLPYNPDELLELIHAGGDGSD